MTTEKQLLANLQNAQLSTGPTTAAGKYVVATNAIKHGIFTKDLILNSDIGQESEEEYSEILNNLKACLCPCNQMESLLVEKIAIDFWRLRRIIRFETGSIAQGIKSLLKEFYSHGTQNNEKNEEEIHLKQQLIEWNVSYLRYLTEGKVTFDLPQWKDNDFTSDIIEDLYVIAKSLNTLTKGEKEMLYNSFELHFEELRALLKKYGYHETKEISNKLIEIYTKQNHKLEEEIQKLSKQKLMNNASNSLIYNLGMTPPVENTEKIMKYERSLQKSIFQNIIMLKKLQGAF